MLFDAAREKGDGETRARGHEKEEEKEECRPNVGGKWADDALEGEFWSNDGRQGMVLSVG